MVIGMSILACSLGGTPSSTPTPNLLGGEGVASPPSPNRCEGLSGGLEIQILVGPSDVVGLEPLAVGTIPFSVVSDGGIYLVQGNGSIAYQDVLYQEWGTYTVDFNLSAVVSGMCEGGEADGTLNITVEANGEQMVEVRAEGFQGDYPWSGSFTYDLSFPIAEGASAGGEGYTFILHLNE